MRALTVTHLLTCNRFSPDIQLHTVTPQMDCTPSFIPLILACPPPHPLAHVILTSLSL